MLNSHDQITFGPSAVSSSADDYPYEPHPVVFRVQGPGLKRPLLLSGQEIDAGQTMVCDEILSAYGVGDSLDEALEDFLDMLFETRAELDQSRSELSQHLAHQLHMLEYFLGPVPR